MVVLGREAVSYERSTPVLLYSSWPRQDKTTLQKCAVVLRRARISGTSTVVSLNSRLDSDKEQGKGAFQNAGLVFVVLIDSGGVPRKQKMLKGHLPRVIYHQVC